MRDMLEPVSPLPMRFCRSVSALMSRPVGRKRDGAGHIGDAVVSDAVDFVSRISVGRKAMTDGIRL
jgi:hypothetical protein